MNNGNDMTNREQTKILSEKIDGSVDIIKKEIIADYGKQSNDSSKPGGIVVNGNIIIHYNSGSEEDPDGTTVKGKPTSPPTTKKIIEEIDCRADNDDAEALYNKGNCYYLGKGVKQDYTEAVKWYRKAAEQGNADAQYDLGHCYQYGHGVEKDYVEAVKWYRKAAEQGDADAQCNLGYCYDCG